REGKPTEPAKDPVPPAPRQSRSIHPAPAVAQISNLPYRRFPIGGATTSPARHELSLTPQSTTLRYSRLEICATPAATRSLVFGQPAPPTPRTGSGRRTTAANAEASRPPSKPQSYQDDATVVRDSQAQALDQAESVSSEQRDPRAQALWAAAVKEMEKALARLTQATNSPAPLPEALAAEQAAYQALLKLKEHEYTVMRNRNRRNQGGGMNQS